MPLTETAVIPVRAHHDDAGLDLIASEDASIPPGGHAAVGTGVAIALPASSVGMVCPRSGLAAKHRVSVLNAPGIVDAGYRGEVKVILVNHGDVEFAVHAGDRIAQLVITPILTPPVTVVGSLDSTDRGAGGFGSTGTGAPQ